MLVIMMIFGVEREDSDGNVGESDVFEVEREDSDGNV